MTLQERIGELRKSVSLARAMGPPRDESGESQLIEQCRRQDEADLELLESVQADLAAERAAHEETKLGSEAWRQQVLIINKECGDSIRERDAALALVRELEQTVLDVHDALHAECSGKADLPAEIRALRAKVAALEKERDLALHERDGWRSNRDEIHAEMERQTRLKNEERQEKLQRIAVLSAQKAGLVDFVVQAQGHAESNATSCDDCAWIAGQLARVLAAAAKEQEP